MFKKMKGFIVSITGYMLADAILILVFFYIILEIVEYITGLKVSFGLLSLMGLG